MDQKLNKTKYENAVLYFVSNCNNAHLGKTKLNKLLYYLDFISYRDKKSSVTGDNYIHWEHGPVPENVDAIVSSLKESGALDVKQLPHKDSYKFEFTGLKEADLSMFSPYEKKLLEKICEKFELWPTGQIESQTHAEAPWFYSEPLKSVDYKYAVDIDLFPELRS